MELLLLWFIGVPAVLFFLMALHDSLHMRH